MPPDESHASRIKINIIVPPRKKKRGRYWPGIKRGPRGVDPGGGGGGAAFSLGGKHRFAPPPPKKN